ncbi:putative aldo-keto reductase [Xylona heveae TC161]|uniref:Putative aldo-keto reductase n=1 Tax=Xylona heveae (strain CBS 132557 / TC161) TaxID=1328760 RepID=A0A165AII3_XYLHT|nr:putative aldo-keto reductase [Xylona heveae TC161]KZF20539.1 putative aldo-keto reductase [Xylona heveae TC161]
MSSALSGPLPLQNSISKAVLPAFIYGTAWKKAATANLVYEALNRGFTAIDVAAQPKHYREDLVGEALRRTVKEGKIQRKNVFLQTKFTPVNVRASVSSSLWNLRHDEQSQDDAYIDSLVLHSPLPAMAQTLSVWRALEEFVPHRIHHLGISNTTLPVLEALYEEAKVKPAVVQNRFYLDTDFDIPLRAYCRKKGIIYQSFWTLTANPRLLRSVPVATIAENVGIEKEVALYCLVLGLDNTVILNGTKDRQRMASDWEGLRKTRDWARDNAYEWENQLKQFKSAIGEH